MVPGLSLAGWGSVLQGKVLVPCCQRLPGPAGSQAGWWVFVCAKSNIPLTLSRFLSEWHATGLDKTYFQNICKPQWLQLSANRHERSTTKSAKKQKSCVSPRKISEMNVSTWISKYFQMYFSNMVQLFNVYATAQVNTRKYLVMSQIRNHYSEWNTYFDLIGKRAFALVCFVIQDSYFTRADITTETYGKELPIVQENPRGFQLTSCVFDP